MDKTTIIVVEDNIVYCTASLSATCWRGRATAP